MMKKRVMKKQRSVEEIRAELEMTQMQLAALEKIEAERNGEGEYRPNLLSGKLVWVAKGTPVSCDPSSETYWSM